MIEYLAVVFKDPERGYTVTFPDLDCVAFVEDYRDVSSVATGALAAHLQAMRERGADIPVPSAAVDLDADLFIPDGEAVLIRVS